jgi:hypothetical protein
VSMKHAIALNQNPANAGLDWRTTLSGAADVISGIGALAGTYTGPICATLTEC